MCSRSEWIFAFHEAFTPQKKLFLRQNDTSVLTLAAWVHPVIGLLLEPVEAHWFFSASLMGPESAALLEDLLQEPELRGRKPHIAISGLQEGGELWNNLLQLLDFGHEVGALEPILFRSASLAGGAEGFLSRRSAKFRKNLRQAVQRAKEYGITMERCHARTDEEADHAFDRMLAVEARSWKGLENCGMGEEPYRTFYRLVYKRMCRTGAAH
ncbi:MAG: GNAT family N-acetyltransferase, partial [Verrucomicrobia bacterium]|nr:GNAT family N-acetyltransferase [Verrucomicrobiota bacterium]